MSAEALVKQYRPLALSLARQFTFPGADSEDVRQEAMVALWTAARSMKDPQRPFAPFARAVIRNHLLVCVEKHGAQKHLLLTQASRETSSEDADDAPVSTISTLRSRVVGPYERLLFWEEVARLSYALRVNLSPREARCLLRFAWGDSFGEIARSEGLPDRWAVSRAITVARSKLRGAGVHAHKGTVRRTYTCPDCGGPTVKVDVWGRDVVSDRAAPLCNVCQLRRDVAFRSSTPERKAA